MEFERIRAEGLLAQSFYEELAPADRAALEAELAKDAEFRADAADLRAMINAIPVTAIASDVDLLPQVRRAIKSPAGTRLGTRGKWAAIAAGLIAVAAALFVGTQYALDSGDTLIAQQETNTADPLATDLAQARALAAERQYADAYQLLTASLETAPASPSAGEAQLLRAQIAFDELRLYPQAFEAYDDLRVNHRDLYRAGAENHLRFELLDESRRLTQFASLEALDAARARGEFGEYERVVAENPATYVAQLAAVEMARMAGGDIDSDSVPMVTAMERALEQCTDPVAEAQLKLEVAHLYRESAGDAEKARVLYQDVADTGYTALAQAAQTSLAELGR